MTEKINELVDAVNKLKTMAKNTNTVLESLVEENNIHEKQIDELQMKINPKSVEISTPVGNFEAEEFTEPYVKTQEKSEELKALELLVNNVFK